MCYAYYRPSSVPTEAELVLKLFSDDILDVAQIKPLPAIKLGEEK